MMTLPPPIPPSLIPPAGPRPHAAYAVAHLQRGRVVRLGIYSEPTPTITRPGERTRLLATTHSRFSYGRAADHLQRQLGWPSSHMQCGLPDQAHPR